MNKIARSIIRFVKEERFKINIEPEIEREISLSKKYDASGDPNLRTRMAEIEETVCGIGEEDSSNDGDQDMFFANITVGEVDDVGCVPFVLQVTLYVGS